MLSLKKLFLLASEQLLFEVPVFSSTFKQPNYLPMSTNNHLKKKVTAVISILFLLPALVMFMIWTSIGIRVPDVSDVDRQETFLNYFSGLFNNIHVVNIVSIILCLISIIFASGSFRKRLLPLRIIMLITVLVAIFIILFDVSQLARKAY
jgi:hypothetical protein